ncbi:hypothetical protein PNOK_0445700 [Pyrrhoderma noxium]|uniref:Class II aldolase/adducin N-terminal domain-containing protein n=1 Tax=Pyrrhoderma noxium TaxID=2282107 RepID=A0A286UIS8_9AGAM|nr:hypothetical protein PNOK_0445700 [Pyrrhoderma noxium]
MSATGTLTLTGSYIPNSGSNSKQNVDELAKNPLERTWRSNKEGTVRLQSIPDFKGDKYAEREWAKAHLAAAFRYWGKLGYGEGVSGHITIRDPVWPDHYWMNPFAVHFSSIKVSDLVLVSPEGYVTEHGAQLPINMAGFHIHSSIHKARPEIQAIAHCHSIHGKSWSVFGKPIDTLTQDSCLFYDNLAVYKSFGGIVLAPEEGKRIAEALGPKNKTCILQNHGLLTIGHTVDEAAYLFSALENQCRVQLMVEAAAANGLKKRIIDNEDAQFTANTIQYWENTYINFQPEYRLLVEETNGAFLK